MIARLRAVHRRAFVFLALALPLALCYALAGRRETTWVDPSDDPLFAPGDRPQPGASMGLVLVSRADRPRYSAQMGGEGRHGDQHVSVNVPAEALDDPTLALYFTPGPSELAAADGAQARSVAPGSAGLGTWHGLRSGRPAPAAFTPPGILWLCSAREATAIPVAIPSPPED